jgi:hypothetical protein
LMGCLPIRRLGMSWTDGITDFFVSDGTLIPQSDGCLVGVKVRNTQPE